MQIDVLSRNTLKLTLSRLDMFDLDIKYESLSGKNPDTKRLLSNVLRTVKLDKSVCVDFSGERLFVEAFPRPDGGCMLYISCLAPDDEKMNKSETPLPVKRRAKAEKTVFAAKKHIFHFDGLKPLGGACGSLCWQQNAERINIESALYGDGRNYRLVVTGGDSRGEDRLITSIAREYGEVVTDNNALAYTLEHYNLIVAEKAVEKMRELF